MRTAGRLAGLSVDVDSTASHLAGYGLSNSPIAAGDPACTTAVHRALDLFDAVGAEATFFMIGDTAAANPDIPRLIADRGHEVGSHSMTHTLPFSISTPADRRREIVRSKELLEDLSGRSVRGFRSPSWEMPDGLIEALVDAGYSYDASSFPSWALLLLRRRIARLSANGNRRSALSTMQWFRAESSPHMLRENGRRIVSIPLSTVPFLRVPYYNTMSFVMPRLGFALTRMLTLRRSTPIGYVFHAVDFLGLEEDSLDPRFDRHPGMNLPLEKKLTLAEQRVRELQQRRDVVALERIAEEARS